MGLIPDDLEDPYPDTVEYFTSIEEKMRKDDGGLPLPSQVVSNYEQP